MPQAHDSRAYYDRNARAYAERSFHRLDLGALREFGRHLPQGARILDAGCGSGRDLRYFGRAGFQAEGIDASPEMVEQARARSGASVREADLRLVALGREVFDGIWANRCVIHLSPPECQRVLASFFGALKPGGWLFVSIEEGEGEEEDRLDDPQGPPRWIFKYREADFASLIRQSGFRVDSVGREVQVPARIGFLAERIGGRSSRTSPS